MVVHKEKFSLEDFKKSNALNVFKMNEIKSKSKSNMTLNNDYHGLLSFWLDLTVALQGFLMEKMKIL
jgi:hypothetical protein